MALSTSCRSAPVLTSNEFCCAISAPVIPVWPLTERNTLADASAASGPVSVSVSKNLARDLPRRTRVPTQVFLLSPASCGGRRAALLFGGRGTFPLAGRVRAGGAGGARRGVPLPW